MPDGVGSRRAYGVRRRRMRRRRFSDHPLSQTRHGARARRTNHPHFAANGYASLRVDMRGSGDSDGVMEDMYSEAELADTRTVIDWIAAQPWCDGRVGMFGTSWGGTASLQASVDAPAALKAVIASAPPMIAMRTTSITKAGA